MNGEARMYVWRFDIAFDRASREILLANLNEIGLAKNRSQLSQKITQKAVTKCNEKQYRFWIRKIPRNHSGGSERGLTRSCAQDGMLRKMN